MYSTRMLIAALLSLLIVSVYACSDVDKERIDQIVEDYSTVYSDRIDFDKFLSFYSDSIVLEDIVNGDKLRGKRALKDFFNWNNRAFKKISPYNLVVEQKIIEGNTAVLKGYFTKFKWGESEFGPMYFTTMLTFDDSGKIIKQLDWVNYPKELIACEARKNSNQWIESISSGSSHLE